MQMNVFMLLHIDLVYLIANIKNACDLIYYWAYKNL